MTKIFFILNPVTRRFKKFNANKLEDLFPSKDFTYRVEVTKYYGHEQELAKIAVDEHYDIVAVLGGDGTVHKVVQELTFTKTALCILPSTPGSAFAHFARIPCNPMKALELIHTGKLHCFDVGRVANDLIGEKKFLTYIGFNYSGFLSHLLNTKNTPRKSLLDYYIFGYKAFFKYKRNKLKVDFTYNSKEVESFEFSLANINQFACGIKLFPFSNAQDGIFEIFELKEVGFWRFLQMLFFYYFNINQSNSDIVEYDKAESFKVSLEELTYIQMDCEPYQLKGDVSIDMLSQSIKIIVPSDFVD